jgi:hypothetical protein
MFPFNGGKLSFMTVYFSLIFRSRDETEIYSHKSKFASVERKHVLMLNAGGSESTFLDWCTQFSAEKVQNSLTCDDVVAGII